MEKMRIKAAGFGNKSSYTREIMSLATSGGKIYVLDFSRFRKLCWFDNNERLLHNRGSLALKCFALVVI